MPAPHGGLRKLPDRAEAQRAWSLGETMTAPRSGRRGGNSGGVSAARPSRPSQRAGNPENWGRVLLATKDGRLTSGEERFSDCPAQLLEGAALAETGYVSFKRALNLGFQDEVFTGGTQFDYSLLGAFRDSVRAGGRTERIARHCPTAPALRTKGVRDTGRVTANHGNQPYNGPGCEEVLRGCQVADWTWSDRNYQILAEDHLKPPRRLPLDARSLASRSLVRRPVRLTLG